MAPVEIDQIGLVNALEDLLKEGRARAVERERSAFERASEFDYKPIVLFGAGNLGRKTLAGLRKIGIEPLAFADSNPRLWNTMVDDLKVLPPEQAAHLYGMTSVFVITIWTGDGYDRMGDREKQLHALGCRHVTHFIALFWKYPETFLPHYAVDLPHKVHDNADEVMKASQVWSDTTSRYEYLAQVRWRLFSDFACLPNPVRHATYFPPDLCEIQEDEIFVDCGAFDGDTIKSFLLQTKTYSGGIYAFEADPLNFAKLDQTVSTLPKNGSVSIQNAAVGAFNGAVSFCASANEASYVAATGGNATVKCVALDAALRDANPTYIKMDIEGAEIDALAGGAQVIKRCSPVLAICSYHRQDHLWKIPLLIRSINPGYRFFLRPHLLEVWDLVCYAIPPNRLVR